MKVGGFYCAKGDGSSGKVQTGGVRIGLDAGWFRICCDTNSIDFPGLHVTSPTNTTIPSAKLPELSHTCTDTRSLSDLDRCFLQYDIQTDKVIV